MTSFTGKIIGTAAAAVVSTAVCLQCFIALGALWFLCGAIEGPSPTQPTLPLTKE